MQTIAVLSWISVLCTAAITTRWSPQTYPNPVIDPKACHRLQTKGASYVCDPDDIISVEAADKIEATFVAIGKDTVSPCKAPSSSDGGYQVALALMNEFELDTRESIEVNAERMARGLHDIWGVGHASCHDGVLVMVSVAQRQVYISTGEAAGVILSPDRIDWVTERMKDHMRTQEYDDALVRVASDLYHILVNDDVIHGAYDSLVSHLVLLCIVGLFLKVLHSVYTQRRGAARFADCKAKLIKIDKFKRKAMRKGQSDDSTTPSVCPICLEDLNDSRDDSTEDLEAYSENSGSDSVRLLGRNSNAPNTTNGKQQQARSGDAKDSEGNSGGRPSAMLPNCNHEFCVECIERWLQEQSSQGKGMTCPLCRSNIDSDSRNDAANDSNNNSQNNPRNNNGSSSNNAAHPGTHPPDEGPTHCAPNPGVALTSRSLMFMLDSLQHQYPEFVDDEMRSEWERDPFTHRSYHERLEERNPTPRHDPEAVRTDFGSATGSVFTSFGGGSSSGGGGNSW